MRTGGLIAVLVAAQSAQGAARAATAAARSATSTAARSATSTAARSATSTAARSATSTASAALAAAAPATGSPAVHLAASSGRGRPASLGRRIAREAARLVGRETVPSGRDDCSGFVELVYRRARVPLGGSSQELRRLAARRHALRFQRARPGDLVFFRDTIAGQHGITHVGIIDSVARDGAATFVHRSGEGVVRSSLDLRRPRLGRDARGRLHNDILRRARSEDRARLAGELFAGFASAERMARGGAGPRAYVQR